jgi:thiosulfate reductase cytochrome b subunit
MAIHMFDACDREWTSFCLSTFHGRPSPGSALSVFRLALGGLFSSSPIASYRRGGERAASDRFALPFVLDITIAAPGHLHFLAAWVCVLTGLFYVLYGLFSQHFRKNLVPVKDDLSRHSLSNHLRLKSTGADALRYNGVQRLTYLVVVFVMFPLMIWTGLAMSPAVTSVFPWLATFFGGQQSARTIHFFLTIAIVLFVVVHIGMVYRAGFFGRVSAMITGRMPR